MEACPPEIHALIFALACSDDGTTGRSLSLVSRYVRSVSTPFQWQSLAVSGVHQARGFANKLRAVALNCTSDADSDRPRPIYHLFLSTRRRADAADGWPSLPLEDWPIHQKEILCYAARTLRTLAFVAFDPFYSSATCIQDLLKVPFPVLTELTVRGRCTPSQVSLTDANESDDGFEPDIKVDGDLFDPAAVEPGACARPKLRRLHLACAYHGFAYGTTATHNLIQALSPSLTHLRLSMLDMWGSKRVAEILHSECTERGIVRPILPLRPLAVELAIPGTSMAQEVRWARVLPEKMERFVIQPPATAASDFYCSCCMDLRGDADVMRVFDAMGREADARFGYMPTREKAGYGYDEAKMDWLDRIENGGGCWVARACKEEGQVESDRGKLSQGNGRKAGAWKAKKKDTKLWKRMKTLKFWPSAGQRGTGRKMSKSSTSSGRTARDRTPSLVA